MWDRTQNTRNNVLAKGSISIPQGVAPLTRKKTPQEDASAQGWGIIFKPLLVAP